LTRGAAQFTGSRLARPPATGLADLANQNRRLARGRSSSRSWCSQGRANGKAFSSRYFAGTTPACGDYLGDLWSCTDGRTKTRDIVVPHLELAMHLRTRSLEPATDANDAEEACWVRTPKPLSVSAGSILGRVGRFIFGRRIFPREFYIAESAAQARECLVRETRWVTPTAM